MLKKFMPRFKNMLTRLIYLIFLLFFSNGILAQTLMKDGIETPWNTGQIILHNGTTLKGLVRFNEVNGIVSYKENKEALESKSFKETKVTRLFFTDSTNKQHNFYSFQYPNPQGAEILLFEVIREFEDWAVLARKGKVEAIEGKNDSRNTEGLPMARNTRAVLSQVEGIYAIDTDGNIELFQYTTHTEVDGFIADYASDSKKIKKDILEKHMEPYYQQVQAYAKENNLKPKRKKDLLMLLDYYATLIGED